MKAIEFKEVSKTYLDGKEEFLALKPTNLAIEAGEFVAIIGPSGSGKSTFLTLAGGLQTPTKGEIRINGRSLTNLSAKELGKVRFKEIGFILQASNLIPYLRVRDQFRLIDKINKENRDAEMNRLLEQLEIQAIADKYPEDLSGGQKQRVAIAKALYNHPTLILADEPTASLDSERAFEVVNILAKESKAKNKAIVMVTHDLRLIDQCDRVFEMADGVLREKY